MKNKKILSERKNSPNKDTQNNKSVQKQKKVKTSSQQKKRSETEARYLVDAIEQSNEMVLLTDLDGKIEYVNSYLEKITGYKKSEILGKTPRIFQSGYQDQKFYKDLWDTITKGTTWNGLFINKKKDGTLYSEEANIFPIKDKNGKIIKYAAIMRDISVRKQAEEHILQQNMFFNNMIEAFTYPVYVIDVNKSEIIVVNSAAKALNISEGLACNEINYGLIGSPDWLTKDSIQEKVKKTKKPVQFEYTASDENGNTIYRELYGYPIFDIEGNVVQIIEYIMDITDRKKSQEELVKLSQAVEQSLNIVMITDKNSIIEYVNPKFTEITGYTFQEVIGKKASILGERTLEDKKYFLETLQSEGEWRGEFHNRKKNGEYYWEYASIYAIKNTQDIVTHYIKDAVNISKRKQAEEELKAAKEKAEQANRFKSEFLANMSHEIRTPLNSIIGFIELLTSTELDKRQKDYFDTIRDSSKVLLGIIDDILDFSKIESGKLEIDNIKFCLKRELEPIVDMFVAKADEKNIELLYFIDPSLPEYIFGDPLRIKQVLNNLISNAVKFTPEKGSISIEIKLVDMSENSCRIIFSASDNGIGIPEDKLEQIFKAFFQADSSISRKYGGTGLGLAISSHLVKQMKGELKLDSKVGIGSRFHFELTFTEFSGVDIFKQDYNFKNTKCFLYIKNKNDKMQLYNIERYLQSFNIGVETFSSVEDINKSNLDLNNIIFIDYSSNSLDEIKKILKALPDMPVILVANRMDRDFVSLLSNKITKIIFKPVYASKIIGAIIEILFDEKQVDFHDTNNEKQKRISFSAEALAVEDNAVNQKLITLMLKEIGINADIANNGLEAIKKFNEKKYDVILMDVNMPIMDGIEATAKILEIEKSKGLEHTPIIALTAKSVSGDREIILNSGMDNYLSKPISINKLYGVLHPFLKDIKRDLKIEPENNAFKYDLAEIANELGVSADFLKNLIGQFLFNFENYFLAILDSVKVCNYDSIYCEAHKLKGTASNLRLEKLAEYFSEIESNAKNKNSIDYGEILVLIKEEFHLLEKNFSTNSGV